VKVSEEWIDPDGTTTNLDYTAKYDGKEYPAGRQNGAMIVFTRHDAQIAEGRQIVNNILAYTFKRTVSKDRKKLTIEMWKKDPAGKKSKEVLVYDRLE
jgi:hypothetical protein